MKTILEIPPLTYYRLRFHFKAKDDLQLPAFKGSPWRGVFGHALKKTVCPFQRAACQTCLLKDQCLYLNLFETPASTTTSPISSATTHFPHPFILTPPLDRRDLIPQGDTFTTELTLLTPGFSMLPYLIITFQVMGQHGIGSTAAQFELRSAQVRHQAQWQPLFDSVQGELLAVPPPSHSQALPEQISPQQLTLRLLTPLHLKVNQQLSHELHFPHLIQGLSRRIRHLAQLYSQTTEEINTLPLIEAATAIQVKRQDLYWYNVPRFSQRQQRKMKLGGLIGSITYQGELAPFVPWLNLGEALHLGSLTSFGFGKYQLEWES
jgi:hypothetical protein